MALVQGYPTADDWLDDVDAADIGEWFTYFRVEPTDQEKADYRHAVMAYLIAITGGAKKVKLQDFLPKWEPEVKKPQTVQEAVQVAIRATLMMGGTIT